MNKSKWKICQCVELKCQEEKYQDEQGNTQQGRAFSSNAFKKHQYLITKEKKGKGNSGNNSNEACNKYLNQASGPMEEGSNNVSGNVTRMCLIILCTEINN